MRWQSGTTCPQRKDRKEERSTEVGYSSRKASRQPESNCAVLHVQDCEHYCTALYCTVRYCTLIVC